MFPQRPSPTVWLVAGTMAGDLLPELFWQIAGAVIVLTIALVLVGKACDHTIHPIPCPNDEDPTSQEASRRSGHRAKSFTARRIKELRPHHHCLKQKRMLQSALQQHQGLNASMLKDVEDFKFKISTGFDEAKQQVDAAKTMAKEAVEAKSSIEKQFASAKEELKKQVEEAEAEAKRAKEAKSSTAKELASAKQEVEEMKELVEKLKAEAAEQMKDVESKMQAQLDEANATVDEERAKFEPAMKQQWIGGRLEMRSEMRNKILAVKRQADEAKSAADKELAEARAALNEELEQAKAARAEAQNAADALAVENEALKALLNAPRSPPEEEAAETGAVHQSKTATAPAPEDVQEVLATPDDQAATAAQESPVWDPAAHGLVVQPANASVARGIKKARNKVLGMGVAGFVKKWVGPKGCKPRVRAVKMLRVDNVPEGWRKHVEEWLEWEHGGFQSEFEMMERFKKNPHILNCFDLIWHEDQINVSMVLELMRGSLRHFATDPAHALSPADGFVLLDHLIDAVAAVHAEGIWHRDIKIDNVGYVVTPHGYQFKLMDFGQAVAADKQDYAACGTPGYRPLEQARGKPYGAKVDVYAVFLTVMYACDVGTDMLFSDEQGHPMVWDEESEEAYHNRVAGLHDERTQDWTDMKAYDADNRPDAAMVQARVKFIKENLNQRYHVLFVDGAERDARNRDLASAILESKCDKELFKPLTAELQPLISDAQNRGSPNQRVGAVRQRPGIPRARVARLF